MVSAADTARRHFAYPANGCKFSKPEDLPANVASGFSSSRTIDEACGILYIVDVLQ